MGLAVGRGHARITFVDSQDGMLRFSTCRRIVNDRHTRCLGILACAATDVHQRAYWALGRLAIAGTVSCFYVGTLRRYPFVGDGAVL